MANVIAVIWDCDKTLIDGYMQDPIFKEYKIDSAAFWRQVDAVQSKLVNEYQIRINTDTYYLNQFIKCAHDGTFPGLSNANTVNSRNFIRGYRSFSDLQKKACWMKKNTPNTGFRWSITLSAPASRK